MAQPIEMLFWLCARIGRTNRVRWGSRDAEGRCHGSQFMVQFAITGFVGYNFGYMIASDMLFDSSGGSSRSSYQMKT